MSKSCAVTSQPSSASGELTQVLRRLANGDLTAREELAPHVYGELHKLAKSYLRREKQPHVWQTTELLNEAYLKLVGSEKISFKDRSHFFGIAAQIMRRILTDYARQRGAEKRGGKVQTFQLDDSVAIVADEQCGLIADLDEALERLEAIHPQAARVVELRFFGGLTEEEIASLMEVSSRTVRRLWMTARAWLMGELNRYSQ